MECAELAGIRLLFDWLVTGQLMLDSSPN